MNNVTPKNSAVRAIVHIYIPLYTPKPFRFRTSLLRSAFWHAAKGTVNHRSTSEPSDIDTRFYLHYIDRIFNNGTKKQDLLRTNCLVMKNDAAKIILTLENTPIEINALRLYCFDTSIAFLDLRVEFTRPDLKSVSDICASLRRTNVSSLTVLSSSIPLSNEEDPHKTIAVNDIARAILSPVGAYQLFDHLSNGGETRADLFTTVISDETDEDVNLNLYRIASGLDSRYSEVPPDDALYRPFHHLRWAITRKGACSIGLKTDEPKNRDFVEHQWSTIAETRHSLWYILVLHQKHAMYHYLNDIAEKDSPTGLKDFQEKVMLFNTKYRYEIISEDPTYQTQYGMARDAKSVESVFSDIDEEIERINDYHDAVSDKNNGVAMTIVSLVCAISTFIDIYTLSQTELTADTFLSSLNLPQIVLYLAVISAMAVALGLLVIKPILKYLFPRARRLLHRIYTFFFLR